MNTRPKKCDIIDEIIISDGRKYIKQYLWVYEDETFTIGDDCGDHEEVDESDIEEIIQGFKFFGAPEQYYEGYEGFIAGKC